LGSARAKTSIGCCRGAKQTVLPTIHPVVRVHPGTGRFAKCVPAAEVAFQT
jgi:hypothetical protein